jgi:16S rRNA (adenine1518-N6/adenine1519-N6)-dimethyltransferase
MLVRAKKHLGQHFLKNQEIAFDIVQSLKISENQEITVLEIGAGMGVLTQFLVKKDFSFYVIEIDKESIEFLISSFPKLKIENKLIDGDFLKFDLESLTTGKLALIGNFPYNISSQILFRLYENKNKIPQLVGMFQKEVAERIASKPGNKSYGILSVLLQVYYHIEYLFTVNENEFNPPPKVKSAVIRLTRNTTQELPCNEIFFKTIVKAAFNQRRKMLSNSLKQFLNNKNVDSEILKLRPEQLSPNDFIQLTLMLQ